MLGTESSWLFLAFVSLHTAVLIPIKFFTIVYELVLFYVHWHNRWKWYNEEKVISVMKRDKLFAEN